MPRLLIIFSQSDKLIRIVATNLHNSKQCRSRSVGFFRSQLIWIYTVCKGRVYPGSAGQGLSYPQLPPNPALRLSVIGSNYASSRKHAFIILTPLNPKLAFTGVYIIFLTFAKKNIDCGYSLEPPRRGGSNEYP